MEVLKKMGPQSWSGGFGENWGPQSWSGGFDEKWALGLVWRFWRRMDLRAGLEVLKKNVLSQLGFKP